MQPVLDQFSQKTTARILVGGVETPTVQARHIRKKLSFFFVQWKTSLVDRLQTNEPVKTDCTTELIAQNGRNFSMGMKKFITCSKVAMLND